VWLWALLVVSQAAVTSAITGDGTLRTTVTRSASGTIYTIAGGTRPGNGPNLFHSFDRFSVGTGDTALFSGSGQTGIVNILSRVSGGQLSEIDGILRSDIQGANLFLLNPSGVLFGPHASTLVGNAFGVTGSLHVSTADFLRLADGAKFFANLGQESRFTMAAPEAFGFLGSTPAPITIQGSSLRIPGGRTLSVVGGDITIAGGFLQAASTATPSGRIQLASVASPGVVPLELAPDLQVEGFARLGQIELSQEASVTVSSPVGAGTVLIRGGRLLVDNAFVNANTTGAGEGARLGIDVRLAADLVLTHEGQLVADSRGAGRAGDLQLTAGSVYIENASVFSRASASGATGRITLSSPVVTVTGGLITTATDSAAPTGGRAGDVVLEVGRLTLTGGAAIASSTGGTGHGGTVQVTAADSIVISGHLKGGTRRSQLSTITEGHGEAGRVVISTPTLSMDGGLTTARTIGAGRAGDVVLEVGRLTPTGGAIIDSSTSGDGPGGTVTVTATDAVVISGRSSEAPYNFSALSSNQFAPGGGGAAGRIVISTPTLILEDGGVIAAGTLGDGRGGDIVVRGGRVVLTGGAAIIGTSCCAGAGGTVTVTATDAVVISGRASDGTPSHLSSVAVGRGPGGNLHVTAPSIHLSNGGTLAASSSGDGAAGSILLQAGEIFRSDHGSVTTAATRAGGARSR
jgi:filamentous hemagglutinin family protein